MPTLDFHFGAHKTATTFLQSVIKKNQNLFETEGLVVPHHRKVRKFLTVPCQLKSHQRLGQDWQTKYTDNELHTLIGLFFRVLTGENVKHILLSDENFLGHAGHVVKSGVLYSHKKAFLEIMNEFIPKKPRYIFLSYREYASFFSSLYGEYLLNVKPENFVHPDVFVEKVMRRAPNWSNYLATIKHFYPYSEIIIWDYEEAKSNWSPVFKAMFGRKISERLAVDIEMNRRASMSGKSFTTFRKHLLESGAEMALTNLRSIRTIHDKDQSIPFSIFTEEQVDILRERFERHKRLLQMSNAGLTQIY